jgi:hypothetical protein
MFGIASMRLNVPHGKYCLSNRACCYENRSRLKNKCKPNDMKQNRIKSAGHSSNTLVVGCASILGKLKAKANSSYNDNVRMPSIKQISKLLTACNIEHSVSEKTNVVEYRIRGRMYVNSRHMGKKGMVLKIDMGEQPNIELDTSCSYYSFNTWQYAGQLVKLLEGVTA